MRIKVGTLRRLIRESLGPNGWWVLRDGSVVNVPRGKEHADVAAEITGVEDSDSSPLSPDEMLEVSGAIRIRNWGDFVSVRARKLERHSLEILQDALASIGLNARMNVSLYVIGTRYKTTVAEIMGVRNLKELTPDPDY